MTLAGFKFKFLEVRVANTVTGMPVAMGSQPAKIGIGCSEQRNSNKKKMKK